MSEVATYRLLIGDAKEQLRTLPDASVQCCVTSPPYWGLRDYGVDGQIGLEDTPDAYVERLVGVFREVWRVLRPDGTMWLNLGDSFANDGKSGLKPKDLVGVPWRVAFALQGDGWWLRSDCIEEVELYCPCGCGYVLEERIWRYAPDRDIVWAKSQPMPESVRDRPTRSHEYVFLLAKAERYYYDAAAIREPAVAANYHDITGPGYSAPGQTVQSGNRRDKQRGHSRRHAGFNDRWDQMTKAEQMAGGRNKRDVWTVATRGYSGAHYAVMPEAIAETCILAGCPVGGTVLDPFAGSGTTLAVANRLGRHAVGIELNPTYAKLIDQRCSQLSWVTGGAGP